MFFDRRSHIRYSIKLKGKAATENGQVFLIDILDLNTKGARLKTNKDLFIKEGENVYVALKWEKTIKCKAEVRWIKKENSNTILGIKITEISATDEKNLQDLVLNYALNNFSDIYLSQFYSIYATNPTLSTNLNPENSPYSNTHDNLKPNKNFKNRI